MPVLRKFEREFPARLVRMPGLWKGMVFVMDGQLLAIRIRLRLTSGYLADLEAQKAGDVNRFARMVDGRGRQIGSEDLWREFIAGALTDEEVAVAYPEWVDGLRRRATAVGMDIPEGLKGGDAGG